MQPLSVFVNNQVVPIENTLGNNNVFSNPAIFDSIFHKIDIYNKNMRLINEGTYHNLPTIITYNNQEREAISEMLYAIQLAYLQESLKDVMPINESIDYINESIDDLTKKIKELCSKLSDGVKKAWEFIGDLAKRGIQTVKDLLKALEKIFTMLGNNFSAVLKKLGMYNDDFVSNIPDDVELHDISNEDISKLLGENDNKTNRYFIARAVQATENKEIRSDFIGETLRFEAEQNQINEGFLDLIKKFFKCIFGDETDNKNYRPFNTSTPEEIKKTTDEWVLRAKNVKPEDFEKALEEFAKKSNGTIEIISKPVEGVTDNTPLADQYNNVNKQNDKKKDNGAQNSNQKKERVKLDKDNIKKVIAGANPTDKQQMAALGNALHTTPEQAASLVGTIQNAPEETKKKLGIGKILIGSVAIVGAAVLGLTGMGLLPIALLVGGYLSYKTLDALAPSISAKLEPIFLSDKVKNLANKLYNNKFTRLGLGLQKSLNKDDYKDKPWKYWAMMLWNIILYGGIAFFIGKYLAGFLVLLGVSGAVAPILAGAFVCMRNVFKVLLNRTLKVSKDREEGKDTKFMDTMTLVSIIMSFGAFAMHIPFIRKGVEKIVSWLWNFGKPTTVLTSDTTKEEILSGPKSEVDKSVEQEVKNNLPKDVKTEPVLVPEPKIAIEDKFVIVRNPNDNEIYGIASDIEAAKAIEDIGDIENTSIMNGADTFHGLGFTNASSDVPNTMLKNMSRILCDKEPMVLCNTEYTDAAQKVVDTFAGKDAEEILSVLSANGIRAYYTNGATEYNGAKELYKCIKNIIIATEDEDAAIEALKNANISLHCVE